MIRRVPQEGAREAANGRLIPGGNAPRATVIDTVHSINPIDTEAYRKGYAEGFEAGEADGERDAARRAQVLEDSVHEHIQELADERDRLKVLTDGIAETVSQHAQAVETLAMEIALVSLAQTFGEVHAEGELLKRLCSRMVDEFRAKAVRVAVSAQDRPMLPEHIDGLEVVIERGLDQGSCRLVTERGQMESSITLRLKAIYDAMLESLEAHGE